MLRLNLILFSFLGFMLAGALFAEPWYPVKCPSGYSVVKKGGSGHQYHCRKTVTAGRECAYIYKQGGCPVGLHPATAQPCGLKLHPNKPGKIACVSQMGNTSILCSPSTPSCPSGYLVNTSGKILAKDCSTKRIGKRDWRKTCYKKTAETASKETDYKKPDF